MAVLVGFGMASTGVGDRRFLLITGLVIFDYLWFPYPIRQVDISPLYEKLAAANGDGAVLDIPFHQYNRTNHNLAAQTVHQRPISGGYISTTHPAVESAIKKEPALADLSGVPKLLNPVDSVRLLELGFEWVVLHKERRESYRRKLINLIEAGDIFEAKRIHRLGGIKDETFDEIRRQLIAHSGAPIFEDRRVAVFDLRSSADP